MGTSARTEPLVPSAAGVRPKPLKSALISNALPKACCDRIERLPRMKRGTNEPDQLRIEPFRPASSQAWNHCWGGTPRLAVRADIQLDGKSLGVNRIDVELGAVDADVLPRTSNLSHPIATVASSHFDASLILRNKHVLFE